LIREKIVTAVARFDLKLNQEDKDIFARAAALMGTTMAGFVRTAAKEKAQALLERESRIVLSPEDFKAFAASLDAAFAPNPALQDALASARRDVRRV
jgi:uncharacterized protein (DUF1778 family)